MDKVKKILNNIVHVFKYSKRVKLLSMILVILVTLACAMSIVDNNRVTSAMATFKNQTENCKFVIGGEITGIKILANGVLVIDVDDKLAELKEGDVILKLDDIDVESNQDIVQYINSPQVVKEGKVKALVYRDNKQFTKKLKIEYSKTSNRYELGLWVKDSSAGVGTISFYELNSGSFAALGHGITETRENIVVPITSGAIVKANIESIKKGEPKKPGDIKGIIYKETVGEILKNTENGIYGKLNNKEQIVGKEIVEVAAKEEIKEDTAYIYCTTENGTVSKYEIQINSVLLESSGNKNMIIKITDKNLIEKTGGIVQGMSGSPILQNGKLIGAVTHVFLNDPTKGYAVFAEKMIQDMQL